MNTYVEWSALGNILLFGLIIGAGLPTLFAVGVRALEGPGSRDADGQRRTSRQVIAVLCFALIVAAVIGAIYYIASGGH